MDRTPSTLLERLLRAEPGRPLLTFYDDATGERVELSVATTDNWVAKTAGLLVDGLGAEPGDRVALDLPRHWLAAVWALAAWRTGCEVVLGTWPPQDRSAGVAVTVRGPDGPAAATGPAGEVVAVSLLPLAAPFPAGALPAGAVDFAREVGQYPDRFAGPPPAPQAPALRVGTDAWTQQEAVGLAARIAAGWQAGDGARLLVTDPLPQPAELLAATLVPLVVGGSVVLCRHPQALTSPDAAAARASSERVTARASVPDGAWLSPSGP